jgi:hypothetical protein
MALNEWLSSIDRAWPNSKIDSTEESREEEKKATVLVANVHEVVGIDKVISIEKFSLERISERQDGRPKRAAALDSVWKTKSMTDWLD